ncbi:putative membrane protein [Desulfobaculum xiamenense]|uniref:Putative membrane protein n=1 Tax=Desulfobaculum xiamenense TaxID=995050 RepID=A0A846QPK0_9BACT|nr:PACE efflux transporter [Desulfobaculum xiamenense]NJB69107.1 putative membrane protein [Desulfobaculum xiamenense]
MRTANDRLRHAILFELGGLFIAAPVAAWATGKPISHTGVMSISLSLAAMVWNCVYNWLFDHMLVWLGRRVDQRPVWMRTLHALAFEVGFMLLTLPGVAWWMDMPLTHALVMNIGFSSFFMCYAFVYNWGYDIVFPCPVDAEA